MTCRQWLLENDYVDVAALIDEAVARIEAKGKKPRRTWWDTLAGGPGGKASVREGIEFPILRTAQIRQGRHIADNAICRNDNEQPPDVIATQRWQPKARTKEARQVTKSRFHPMKVR
jgi:hypothetical protein